MRSSKSRSRSKANRPRTLGNIVNRVFDSSGPEGKVRGTPQQIIEKYQFLARDAQLSNDRVAAENFLQHAEHYTRMLGEAQREMAAEQEARRQEHGQGGQPYRRDDRDWSQGGGQGGGQPYNGNGNGFGRDPRADGRPDQPREANRDQNREPREDRRDERRDDRRPEQRGDARPEFRSEHRPDLPRPVPAAAEVIDLGDEPGAALVETPEARVEPALAVPAAEAPAAAAPRSGRSRSRGPRREARQDEAPAAPSEGPAAAE